MELELVARARESGRGFMDCETGRSCTSSQSRFRTSARRTSSFPPSLTESMMSWHTCVTTKQVKYALRAPKPFAQSTRIQLDTVLHRASWCWPMLVTGGRSSSCHLRTKYPLTSFKTSSARCCIWDIDLFKLAFWYQKIVWSRIESGGVTV